MNTDSYLTILVAVFCIAAAGLSAATLDSTLTTNPDDVIQLDYDKLPIGIDDAAEIDNEVKSNKGDGQEQGGGGNSGDSSADNSDSDDPGSASSSGTKPDQQSGGGGGADGQDGAGGSGDGQSGRGDTIPWRLIDLLRPLLGLLAIAAFLLLGYRYRRQLLAAGLAVRGLVARDDDGKTTRTRDGWPPGRPDDEIHLAWLRMATALDLDRPYARTPIEVGEAAVAAGLDADAVSTLTKLFRDVRYGGAPASDDRIDLARESLRSLDARTGRGGGP